MPSTVTDQADASGVGFFVDGVNDELTQLVTAAQVKAQVQVISPSISMTKTPCRDAAATDCDPNLLVRPGTDVTFRYLVTNTGDSSSIRWASPTTSATRRRSSPATPTAMGASTRERRRRPGSTPAPRQIELPSPVVNTAVALAVEPLDNIYEAARAATVRFFEPAIHLTKSVSDDLVPVGSTVTYTFHVTNAGTVDGDGLPADVVLSNIDLIDVTQPANPSCRTPTFVGGDDNGNGLLDLTPPEVWTYQCTGVINERTVNAAAVGGLDIQGGPVVDFDAATVTPFVTGINITKSPTRPR